MQRQLKSIIKQKKGDITDSLVFVIYVAVFAIGLFVIVFIINSIVTGLKTTDLNNVPEASAALDELGNMGSIGIQRGFLLVFFGLCAGMIISSFFVRTHPLFVFLYIIFLIISVIIANYLGYTYQTFSQNPAFASIYASQTLFNLIMDNIIKITIAITALSMIIIFSKFSTIFSGGGGPV